MGYKARIDEDDVILSTFDERDRLTVALYLREGDDGMGDEVFDLRDDDAAQAFEDGFLKRSTLRRMSDRDGTLLSSALDYAKSQGMPAVAGFAERVEAAAEKVLEAAQAAYAEMDAAEPAPEDADEDDLEDRRQDLMQKALRSALRHEALRPFSDKRVEDIEGYVEAELESSLQATSAPAP